MNQSKIKGGMQNKKKKVEEKNKKNNPVMKENI